MKTQVCRSTFTRIPRGGKLPFAFARQPACESIAGGLETGPFAFFANKGKLPRVRLAVRKKGTECTTWQVESPAPPGKARVATWFVAYEPALRRLYAGASRATTRLCRGSGEWEGWDRALHASRVATERLHTNTSSKGVKREPTFKRIRRLTLGRYTQAIRRSSDEE
jgi:hypothetical protein